MSEPEFFKSERFVKGVALTVPGEGYGSVIRTSHGKNRGIQKATKGENLIRN